MPRFSAAAEAEAILETPPPVDPDDEALSRSVVVTPAPAVFGAGAGPNFGVVCGVFDPLEFGAGAGPNFGVVCGVFDRDEHADSFP